MIFLFKFFMQSILMKQVAEVFVVLKILMFVYSWIKIEYLSHHELLGY